MSMETDSPVVYHGTSESRFPREEKQKISIPELTLEEKEIIRQCNKESLYYRCLPFSIAGMAAVHYAAKRGFITPHRIWGTTFSMTGAAFAGWILGKFAYRKKCEDKFLHLKNSNIADAIRRKRGYSSEGFQSEFSKSDTSEDMVLKDDSFTYYSDSDYHSSAGSLNLDVDKNIQYSGLDDRDRPSTDRESYYSEESEPTRKFTTYEDLRQRNREEYERSQRRYSPPSKLDPVIPEDQKPYSNIDTTLPRRYNSDIGEGERRTW